MSVLLQETMKILKNLNPTLYYYMAYLVQYPLILKATLLNKAALQMGILMDDIGVLPKRIKIGIIYVDFGDIAVQVVKSK